MQAVLTIIGSPRRESDPGNDETRVAPTIPGLKEADSNRDCRTSEAQCKLLATARAQLAIAGFATHEVTDGFLVCRWDRTRHVASLRELREFARLVGAGT